MSPRAWLSVLALVCFVAVFFSLFIGTSWIAPAEVMSGLLGNSSDSVNIIIQSIRLPRAALAAIVGAGLGASGAALQGFTRNPLAAPGLLGFSACAALGAVLALYFNFPKLVTPTAIGFALFGALAMTAFSRRKPGASGLVLAGIGIGALATAVTGLVMNFAPNPWAGLLIISGPALRVLGLGEETAQSLGISVPRTQWLIVLGCALCIGSGVAVAGAIGFVGLFIPHILRFLTQADEAWLIPLSAFGGAGFLVIIDTLIRASSGPGTPLYLGIVTSLIGVPFFLWLAWRQS